MTKKLKEITKVYLREDMFFNVLEDEYILIWNKKETKTPITLGHYTQVPPLINKAIRVMISDKGTVYTLKTFLKEYNEIKTDLLNKVNF